MIFEDILNKPFNNCYDCIRELCARTGVKIPEENISVTACKENQKLLADRKIDWIEIKQPEKYCIVEIKGTSGCGPHLGFCIGGGRFVHHRTSVGTKVSRLEKWNHRILGYYKHVSSI